MHAREIASEYLDFVFCGQPAGRGKQYPTALTVGTCLIRKKCIFRAGEWNRERPVQFLPQRADTPKRTVRFAVEKLQEHH